MANYINSLVVNYKDTKQLKYGVNNICDNTTYYGSTTWSVIDNGGITGLAVDGSPHDGVVLSSNDDKYLVITNTYTGTNADPMITVKASSDLVSCDSNNTCTIGIFRACCNQSVICEVEINDDSKKYVTSITGQNAIEYGTNSLGNMGYAGGIIVVDHIGNHTGTKTNGMGNCSLALGSEKIYFNFDHIGIDASLSNNIQNFSVSGEVKYKFGDDTYTTLDSLSSDIYTYTLKNGNSINITGCNYKTTQLHDLMDGFKTLYIKHIINLKYDDEVQEVQYKWYTMLPGQDTWSESTEFTITMSENDSYFGVGGIVSISHCTGSDRNDCDSTFTFKNDNTITLNKSWGLSDLRYDNTDDNVIVLYTHKDLYDNLLVADTGTYTISGEIVSSLDGSSFPVTINYEITNVNAWYKFDKGSLVEITELNKNKISLPEIVISEMIVFMQNDNYITDASKYSYEQTLGDVTINLSFEPRLISSSLTCFGIKISATDDEMSKLYNIDSPNTNIEGNIICEEKYKLPISLSVDTPHRIWINVQNDFKNISSVTVTITNVEVGLSYSTNNNQYKLNNNTDNLDDYYFYSYDDNFNDSLYMYIYVEVTFKVSAYQNNKQINLTLQCSSSGAEHENPKHISYPANSSINNSEATLRVWMVNNNSKNDAQFAVIIN